MRKLLATLAAAVLLLTGCDIYSLPLPGGADPGDNPIELTVEFRDVLDLVPHSSVKVNDVSVGKVTKVETKGAAGGPGNYIAEVTLQVPGDSALNAETRADIRQTSLLGEKFVSLEAPPGGPGELGDGDLIPLERTGSNTEIEEVFGALSLILNGGGVAQLKTIARELNVTLEGREDSARSVLRQVNTLVGQLDANKSDIVAALESLNGLAISARRHMDSIDAALDELPSALRSIDRQRDDLIRMLQALNRLSDVGVRVIRTTKTSTIQALRSLQPVLTQLVNSGDALVNSFHTLMAYPIPDETVGRTPTVAHNLQMGDYINLNMDLRLNLAAGIGLPCKGLGELPEEGVPLCEGLSDLLKKCSTQGPGCPAALVELLQSLPDLLPGGLPNLPRQQRSRGGSGEGPLSGAGDLGGVVSDGGASKQLDNAVGELLGKLGVLGRTAPGFGSSGLDPERLEGLAGMGDYYDPALVGLLVRPLAVRP